MIRPTKTAGSHQTCLPPNAGFAPGNFASKAVRIIPLVADPISVVSVAARSPSIWSKAIAAVIVTSIGTSIQKLALIFAIANWPPLAVCEKPSNSLQTANRVKEVYNPVYSGLNRLTASHSPKMPRKTAKRPTAGGTNYIPSFRSQISFRST